MSKTQEFYTRYLDQCAIDLHSAGASLFMGEMEEFRTKVKSVELALGQLCSIIDAGEYDV